MTVKTYVLPTEIFNLAERQPEPFQDVIIYYLANDGAPDWQHAWIDADGDFMDINVIPITCIDRNHPVYWYALPDADHLLLQLDIYFTGTGAVEAGATTVPGAIVRAETEGC